ncbi:MAG: TetR/AcrR family transcriptional regulator [Candidatus Fermentibacteraceae bacterium]|nr:TetR/AcrR family transcriptional regulator [Candidatus Fermentibacteraceae bacterium]
MHNSKETKIIILDIAIILYTGHLYANISMPDIPKTCGLTKPSVYYHFKNKQGLFLALTQRILGRIKTILITIIESYLPLREALILMVEARIKSLENQTDLVRAYLSFLLVPDNQLLIRTLKVR